MFAVYHHFLILSPTAQTQHLTNDLTSQHALRHSVKQQSCGLAALCHGVDCGANLSKTLSRRAGFLCSFLTWDMPGFEWAGFWRCRILRLSLSKRSLCILVVSQSLPDRDESAAVMARLQVSVLTLCCALFVVQFSHLKSIFPLQISFCQLQILVQLSLPGDESSEGRV